MNRNINSLLLTVMLAVGAASTTGCASIAVSDDAIVERTAFALGAGRGDFTVSTRVDDGTGALPQASRLHGPPALPAIGHRYEMLIARTARDVA
ncbi:hypothetical protein [Niveibacterium sp.]|uniref:hypothetical protein n=1 Tax=Niveibacterium sp. TaxID=2017444 RepID=UPI0035B1C55F